MARGGVLSVPPPRAQDAAREVVPYGSQHGGHHGVLPDRAGHLPAGDDAAAPRGNRDGSRRGGVMAVDKVTVFPCGGIGDPVSSVTRLAGYIFAEDVLPGPGGAGLHPSGDHRCARGGWGRAGLTPSSCSTAAGTAVARTPSTWSASRPPPGCSRPGCDPRPSTPSEAAALPRSLRSEAGQGPRRESGGDRSSSMLEDRTTSSSARRCCPTPRGCTTSRWTSRGPWGTRRSRSAASTAPACAPSRWKRPGAAADAGRGCGRV